MKNLEYKVPPIPGVAPIDIDFTQVFHRFWKALQRPSNNMHFLQVLGNFAPDAYVFIGKIMGGAPRDDYVG